MAKGPLRPVPVSHASPKAVERVLETLDSAGASDSAETRETRLDDVTPAPATKEQENKGLRTIAAAAAATTTATTTTGNLPSSAGAGPKKAEHTTTTTTTAAATLPLPRATATLPPASAAMAAVPSPGLQQLQASQLLQQQAQAQAAYQYAYWSQYMLAAMNQRLVMGTTAGPVVVPASATMKGLGLPMAGISSATDLGLAPTNSNLSTTTQHGLLVASQRRKKGSGAADLGRTRDRSIKKTSSSATQNKVCSNCGTSSTPFWRKNKVGGLPLCNACGLYCSKNDAMRPRELWRGEPGASSAAAAAANAAQQAAPPAPPKQE